VSSAFDLSGVFEFFDKRDILLIMIFTVTNPVFKPNFGLVDEFHVAPLPLDKNFFCISHKRIDLKPRPETGFPPAGWSTSGAPRAGALGTYVAA
jgi:hypothetical protein